MQTEALEEYELWLSRKSAGTALNYLGAIKKIPDTIEEQKKYLIDHKGNRMLYCAYRNYLRFLKSKKRINNEELFDLLDEFKPPRKSRNQKQKKSFLRSQWREIIKKAPHRTGRFAIWIGFEFGLRREEILHLRVEDINFDKEIIAITSENRTDSWHPKYENNRYLPFNDRQARTLKRWVDELPIPHPEYLIFNPRSGKKISATTIRRWCIQADPDLRPHGLRYSYATNLYDTTKDIKVVQENLGHSNPSITYDYLCLDLETRYEKTRKAMA